MALRGPRMLSVVVLAAGLVVGGVVVTVASVAGATTVTDETSFRAAWTDVNETKIDLAADITLTCGGGGVAVRNSTTALTLDGHGHTITQTCASNGVLEQDGLGALTVQDVTITGGTHGGGGVSCGGGVFSNGAVTLMNATVTGNSADDGGGGICTNSSATLTKSTVSGNTTPNGNGGGVDSIGAVTLTNSTVSANTAGSDGGGVFAISGSITATNSTITNNTAPVEGGGVSALDVSLVYATVVTNTAPTGANIEIRQVDSLTSFGSVVALPHGGGANCGFQPPPVTHSNGFNFADDTSCGFTATSDNQALGNNPNLGPLANNGGPTQTRLPQPGSPLIDAIPIPDCGAMEGIGTDQRGISRPQGPGCDIGAVEVVPAAPTAVVVTPKFTG